MSDNPLFRQPSPTILAENPYARWGLKSNPFPDVARVIPESADPRSNGSIYVEQARAREQARFEELLIPRPGRAVRPMAFLKDQAQRKGRGLGKTAFLNHQRQRIMTDLGQSMAGGAQVMFAAHVCTPTGGNSRKFWQFARAIFRTLNDQDILARLVWRLRVFSDVIPKKVLKKADDARETIGNDKWLEKHEVDIKGELTPAVAKALTIAGVDSTFADALAQSGASAEEFERRFLRGQTDHRWRQNATQWLTEDLVAAFRAGQFTRGILLIDDFEKSVLEQNAAERRVFVDSIRYSFLDGPTAASTSRLYAFLWVINPYVQELLVGDWNAAGLARFCALSGNQAPEYSLDFLPLGADDVVQLVLAYLDQARIDAARQGSLEPFDEAAIGEAARINGSVPGFILQMLQFGIEHGIRENWERIDSERIRELARLEATPGARPEGGRLPAPDVDLRADEDK